VIGTLLAFCAAAVLEIAGCFAFWAWLRRGAPIGVAALGVASLIGFAAMLARVEVAFAGRAYAAYGGIYIAASLAWLWMVEGQKPTLTDAIGAAVAICGGLIIIGFAARTS
jgi:small multidrug resistance family-3 protein